VQLSLGIKKMCAADGAAVHSGCFPFEEAMLLMRGAGDTAERFYEHMK